MRIALIATVAVLALPAAAGAAFPGSNGKIAFVSDRETVGTGNLEIYTMNAAGGDIRRLTTDSHEDDRPAWSPDGSQIAFEGFRDGSSSVLVMNGDGTGQTTINGPGWFGATGDPSWSPDGSRIVFQGQRAPGSVELYVVNSDGSGNLTRLTDNDEHDITPAWSPDGSQIAFARPASACTTDCDYEIFVMDATGANVRRLTFAAGQDKDPNWSPDGRKIVWSNFGGGSTEVLAMNADGTGQHSLAPGAEPAWSPDGSKIAWTGFGDFANGWEVNVMNADGSGQHVITNSPAFEARPDWQPVPNRPPNCSSVTTSRPVLTTANRRLVALSLDGGTDPDGDSLTITVDRVTQDEPVTGQGDQTSPDAIDEGEGELRVRAERSPRGDGRVYRIAFTVSDGRGGSCSGTTTVAVPRKKKRPAVDSAPPSYDSFAR